MNAAKIHRISNWCYNNHLRMISKIFQFILFAVHGCRIPPYTIIGKGTSFTAKGMGVIMNGKEIIGENCQIGHQVKFLGKAPYHNCAKVGNNVFISSGAVIMGNVIIEDDCIIGANSVVTKSLRKGSIVAGIPATIIGTRINKNDISGKEITEDLKNSYQKFL